MHDVIPLQQHTPGVFNSDSKVEKRSNVIWNVLKVLQIYCFKLMQKSISYPHKFQKFKNEKQVSDHTLLFISPLCLQRFKINWLKRQNDTFDFKLLENRQFPKEVIAPCFNIFPPVLNITINAKALNLWC